MRISISHKGAVKAELGQDIRIPVDRCDKRWSVPIRRNPVLGHRPAQGRWGTEVVWSSLPKEMVGRHEVWAGFLRKCRSSLVKENFQVGVQPKLRLWGIESGKERERPLVKSTGPNHQTLKKLVKRSLTFTLWAVGSHWGFYADAGNYPVSTAVVTNMNQECWKGGRREVVELEDQVGGWYTRLSDRWTG